MARPYAKAQAKMDLRNKTLAANAAELPHLEPKRLRLDALLTEARSLTAEQATLTAKKQDVSKRLAVIMQEGNTLMDFLDTGVRQHYGRRAEKLVEFGLQPFRSRPRLVQPGPDDKRLKESPEEPASS